MKPLRTGMLGCGGIAQKHAHAAMQLDDEIELVAFCGHTEANARAFAGQFTVGRGAVFTDHRVMFNQANLDLLIVCLPPFAHTTEIELAVERGIHLLVEKPIALSSEQAWRRVEAAERSGIKTQVGFMYRFGAAMEEMKARLAAGTAGLFSARYFCNSLHASWWRAREKSGGQLVEQVIHLFDAMRVVMGEPVSVFSQPANVFHRATAGYTAEDVSATLFGFPNGGLGVIYAANGALPGQWIKEWRVVTQNLVAEFADWNHATFTHWKLYGEFAGTSEARNITFWTRPIPIRLNICAVSSACGATNGIAHISKPISCFGARSTDLTARGGTRRE